MLILVIPIVIAALIAFERYLYRKTWNRLLNVELTFDAAPATEGERSRLVEVVTNGKHMGVPILEVGFALDTGLRIEEAANQAVSDQTNVVEVFSIHGREKVTRELTIDCLKRGYYIINRTTLMSHDMLTLSTGYMNLDQHTHLYVYPRKLEREMLELPMEKIMGEISTRRFLYENIFLLRGVRDYVPTDPQNSVNWKATARTGDLKVNLHDHSAGQNVRILLNVEDPTIWYDDRILEDGISLAAAIAGELIGRGIPVGVITNAQDKMSKRDPLLVKDGERKGGRSLLDGWNQNSSNDNDRRERDGKSERREEDFLAIGEGASADHLKSINELLARMDLTKEKLPYREILLQEVKENGGNDSVTYIFISSSRKKETAEAAEALGLRKGKLVWIAPLTKDMMDEPIPPHVDFMRMDREV